MDNHVLWREKPSQVINLGWFLFSFFLLTIPYVLWRYLVVRSTEYTITPERLITTLGVLDRAQEEIELYRIKDYEISQPFIYRMFGIANIRLISTDKTTPVFIIKGIENPEYVQSILRENVEGMRTRKGVREID
jgi:uncharacterized membrane protein YdbT with pleckstrin-like domain